ncbi:PREDICTED: GDSL esterase/lipase At5g55050-like [Fragaria vesca subsp. vesca]|uniref:GDSL esterase/lipase At5g55050-like n=1 Tax=Fragaria vesca subsp. vesca TaxID=101020 RepID=UPI0002C2EA44|nr:PREDICTED: GDSL esterase/lipase At5g55050-like [Fragaria vesca subsp. vesca]
MATKWVLPLILSLFIAALSLAAAAKPVLPPVFILGDSTADIGTNNYLPGSTARADFPHNGIDFPNSPRATGRFSNGLNSADFLARHFGYKRSPRPFLSLSATSLQKKKFRGINFASGGSGLFDLTGQSLNNQKNVVPLTEQIQQFSSVKNSLTALMGAAATKKFLSKSLIFISIGSNDLFRYYHSNSSTPKEKFLSSLLFAYENHLKNLYNLGARKFGIISVAPIGCCPSQRIFNATGGCLEELNDHAVAFHSKLDSLLCKLSTDYEGFKYSLGNSYEMTMNVIQNPLPFNFTQVEAACCGAGKLNAESYCTPNANLCSNRDQYLFWDVFHPSQAASKLAAVTLYYGGPEYVSPINFAQLAEA